MVAAGPAQAVTMRWTHLTIADPLPGSAWGTGGIPLADLDGDGDLDVVLSRREPQTASWFERMDDAMWARHTVGKAESLSNTLGAAALDINDDGWLDVVLSRVWLETPGDGTGPWPRHAWPHRAVPKASYGTSMRAWITDVNGDTQNDIVYSDCDTGWSHVYWVENLGKGLKWKRHQLPDPPTAPGDVAGTGSFHSLGVADFDRDGDLDIFAGEQEDPDTYMESGGKLAMKPRGLKERGVVWTSSQGSHPTFTPIVIHTDNPGWHDGTLGDVDGDGDIDIVTKIWNKDGPTYHADYRRNDTVATGR
jgi:hypothetical protein